MKKQDLPEIIPLFPLGNFIIFPNTTVPLNIFEPRYLALVNDSIKSNKYMGMIQAKKNSSDVYSIGCLGKITEHKKIKDGRLLLSLTGISRFEIKSEINNDKIYREFEVSYERFTEDLEKEKKQILMKEKVEEIFKKTKIFFKYFCFFKYLKKQKYLKNIFVFLNISSTFSFINICFFSFSRSSVNLSYDTSNSL